MTQTQQQATWKFHHIACVFQQVELTLSLLSLPPPHNTNSLRAATHLWHWRHQLHLQATPPSALASLYDEPAQLLGNLCLVRSPSIALCSELWRECDVNEAGINLLWQEREGAELPHHTTVSPQRLSACSAQSCSVELGRRWTGAHPVNSSSSFTAPSVKVYWK